MSIVISLIEKYCEKNGSSVHTSISIEENSPTLFFTLGKYEQHGSITVLLTPYELDEILRINGIIGKGSPVEKLINSEDLRIGVDKEIEKLIYNTLSKYVLQMLFASRAEILFPEIVPLPKHKVVYFRTRTPLLQS